MGFRQTYKGIFQFQSQAELERAMAENQAEAMGADAMGLQDSFHSEGVMLLDVDTEASQQDWEEMAVAMATLAMHATKGFLVAVSYNDPDEPEVEYYAANAGGEVPLPTNAAPEASADYFPMIEGARMVYNASIAGDAHQAKWTVRKVEDHGHDYFYFENEDADSIHYNDYWDGTYYRKDGALVYTVFAGNEAELNALNAADQYASQVVYNTAANEGDVLYTIWNQSNIFVIFTVEGFTDLQTTYGALDNCMHVRVQLYHVTDDVMDVETHHQYFAKGIGLVKWEKGDDSLELAEYNAS